MSSLFCRLIYLRMFSCIQNVRNTQGRHSKSSLRSLSIAVRRRGSTIKRSSATGYSFDLEYESGARYAPEFMKLSEED
jgi:hypothetical protein